MKPLLYRILKSIRQTAWSILVAYMLGVHNFYKGEDKNTDDIVITIEYNVVLGEGAPKN